MCPCVVKFSILLAVNQLSLWQKICVSPGSSIRQAIEVMDAGSMQIVLVADAANRLLGTVTDGDIRRGILRGLGVDDPVDSVMNRESTVARVGDDQEQMLAIMRLKHLHQLPVLDQDNSIVGLQTLDELVQLPRRENVVVLMAGGLGSRLRPLTDDCPKPMLQVGNKPLLETILCNFVEHGFRKFLVSVNYMADKVVAHFGNGAKWGVEIEYLHETQRLGTAGALGLIRERSELPMIVMNGDILTKVNFQQLLDFHVSHKAKATMCVREYDFQVPYGVVKLNHHRIVGIDEKPVQRFFVNAGIYVLNPDVLEVIPRNSFFDMPTLFENVAASGNETAAFPIREYWLDIGQMADYDRANGEFARVFS